MNNNTLNIRRNMVKVALHCNGKVHWGSSLSCVEILYVLYSAVTNVADITIPDSEKDEIIVSKGQGALAVYATMHEIGMINDDYIYTFQSNGNDYSEEIMVNEKLRIPCSTGSLGIGMPFAVGLALKKKRKKQKGKVYVVMGDGECDEGSNWEAAMLAAHYNLENLVVIIDYNGLQADGFVKDIMKLDCLRGKFEAFGFTTLEVDGHDCEALEKAIKSTENKPYVIIARTVKGKGISFMENDFSWHDRLLGKEFLKQACEEMGVEYAREQ